LPCISPRKAVTLLILCSSMDSIRLSALGAQVDDSRNEHNCYAIISLHLHAVMHIRQTENSTTLAPKSSSLTLRARVSTRTHACTHTMIRHGQTIHFGFAYSYSCSTWFTLVCMRGLTKDNQITKVSFNM